jgi:predicted RNA-binding protein with TRAM domain
LRLFGGFLSFNLFTVQLEKPKGRSIMSRSRQGGSYEGRRGHGKGFKRCPVMLGEELEVEISELSPKGEGIARSQGFVIYVAGTKPGDHVRIKVIRITEKAANGQVVK